MKPMKILASALVLGMTLNLAAVETAHAGLLVWGALGGFNEKGENYILSDGTRIHIDGIPEVVHRAETGQLVAGGILCGLLLEFCALDTRATGTGLRVPTEKELLAQTYSKADAALIIRDAKELNRHFPELAQYKVGKNEKEMSFVQLIKTVYPKASEPFIHYLQHELFVPSSPESVSDSAVKPVVEQATHQAAQPEKEFAHQQQAR